MEISTIILIILAAWRVASLLADEHGPLIVLERIRFLIGVHYMTREGKIVKTHKQFCRLSEQERATSDRIAETELAKGITCVWCSSVWIAALLIFLILWFGQPVVWVMLPFSVSTGVIIVNRIING